MRNALNILDASFEGNEDFMGNSNRLAARNMYVKSLNKAIAENNTKQLVLLTNKEHVQSVGQSFQGMHDVEVQPVGEVQHNDIATRLYNEFKRRFTPQKIKLIDESSLNTDKITDDAPQKNIYEPTLKELKERFKISDEYQEYTDEAFEEVQKAKGNIHAAAKAFDVPATSIAGAIVDEYSAQEVWIRGFGALDGIQDWYVNDSNLEDVRENYANGTEGNEIWSPDSAKHDIGPGNFGVRTALELFEKHIIQDKGNNPIKSFLYKSNATLAKATDQEKWEAYIKNMVLTTEGTAWLAAAEIQKGQEALEKAGAMNGLSEKEREAVLMTWYKQGQPYLDRYNERPKSEVRPIGVGEGRGLFHYYDKFEEILK